MSGLRKESKRGGDIRQKYAREREREREKERKKIEKDEAYLVVVPLLLARDW